jgi:hypothetical protein
MSWTLYKVNVLKSLITLQYAKDLDGMSEFIAKEYDACIKRGGDMIYGVPVMNGNVTGMADVIKRALKKGQDSGGENYNFLAEIYPAAFDAYWLGAEMAPIPNPLLKPGGWPTTPPAPGTIQNIGPNPISLSLSAAAIKALKEALKKVVEELKEKTVNIPPIGDVKIYETILKIIKKEKVDDRIKNHPVIKQAVDVYKKYEEAKKKKPSIGAQIKKAIKFPFPELPKRSEIIKKAEDKLIEEAIKVIEESIIKPIEETILTPIYAAIESAVALADNIPNPKPTKEQIKKYVRDTIDGLIPEIELPGIAIPKIPTKQELKQMIKDKIPTKEELKAMAYDMIKDKIPQIPNIWFIPPTFVFSYPTNILLDPFVNIAKFHLMGVSGNMSVMAQYPPPAPPAPAILNWTGYRVIG